MTRTSPSRRRITLDLDESLLSALDATASLVKESRSGFIVSAIAHRLEDLERARVDADFADMASDPTYLAELRAVEQEMAAGSDAAWRALETQEAAPAPAPPRRAPARAARKVTPRAAR